MNNLGFHCHGLDHLEEVIVSNGLQRGEFYHFSPQELPGLRQKIAEYSLRFSIHTPLVKPLWYPEPPTWSFLCSLEEDKRQLSLKMVEGTVALAQDFGADYVVVHYPSPSSPQSLWASYHRLGEIAWDSALRIAEINRRYGVPIHLEGFSPSPFLTVEFLSEVFTQFPDLRYCFDTGHMHIASEQDGFDLYRFAEQIAPFVGSIHLWNNRGLADYLLFRHIPLHPSQRPEEGWVDIERVLRAIVPQNPSCYIILESGFYYPPALGNYDYQDGVRWVKRLMATLY